MKSVAFLVVLGGMCLCVFGFVYITLMQSEEVRAKLDAAKEVQPVSDTEKNAQVPAAKQSGQREESVGIATFGSGCFWCTEAFFERLKGVKSVESGYSGGDVENPTYKFVCTGSTGHAEVVQIKFDPKVISFDELLSVFWKTHDPTTLNRQGADVGTQYRSAIFYHNDQQKELAHKRKKQLDASGAFRDPIVTEITPFSTFYVAEVDHQDYYRLNGRDPYCNVVIRPKMDKFEKAFADKLVPTERQ